MRCEFCDGSSTTYSAPSVDALTMVALHHRDLSIHLNRHARTAGIGIGIGLYLDLPPDGGAELLGAIATFEAESTWKKTIRFKAFSWGGGEHDSEEPKLVTVTVHNGWLPNSGLVAHVE